MSYKPMEQLSQHLNYFYSCRSPKKYLFSNKGFTLIEMLIVLTIWSVMVAIIIPASSNLWEAKQLDNFFRLLQEDVLYMQNVQMTTFQNLRLFIDKENISYQIREGGTGKVYITRDYPDTWQIELRTLDIPIEFSTKGAIKKPGTMVLHANKRDFVITFPIGRGRLYVKEQ